MYPIIPVSQSILTTVTVVGSITPSQLPIFGVSGPLHNVGAVPDPGAIAGTSRFLGEAGWAVPPGASGSVSNVGLTLPPGLFTPGNTVTDSGTLTASFVTQNTNTFFAGPASAGTGLPAFRLITANDVPAFDASKITTGTVPLTLGGTGATTAGAARTSLGAASIGANSDITSLTQIVSLASPSSLAVSSTGAITLSPGSGGIFQVTGASNVTNVMRLRAGVAANNVNALLFYGANFGGDLWSIGNAISTGDTARAFEIYDVPNSLARLRILNTGTVIIPTGDLQLQNALDTQNRTVTCRSTDASKETSLTYYGGGVAGNIFSSIPFSSLGALAFKATANATIYTTTNSPLILGTFNTARVFITGPGLVGIGVSNPTVALEVGGSIKSGSTFIGDGSGLTGFTTAQIPNLDGSKITTGTIDVARMPPITAGGISSSAGSLAPTLIPNLDASKITSGTLGLSVGGTGGTTQLAALNNILPSQSGQAGKQLQSDGTNASWQPAGGTVTSFSAGSLSPLFTTGVATSVSTPSLTFSFQNAQANSWFGNATSSSAAPTYNTTPIPVTLLPANIKYGVVALPMTASTQIDWSTSSSFSGTLGNSVTFTFSNASAGQSIRVKIVQSTGFGWTVTWPNAVLWTNGADPVMSSVSARVDFYVIYYDGANYIGYVVPNCF